MYSSHGFSYLSPAFRHADCVCMSVVDVLIKINGTALDAEKGSLFASWENCTSGRITIFNRASLDMQLVMEKIVQQLVFRLELNVGMVTLSQR